MKNPLKLGSDPDKGANGSKRQQRRIDPDDTKMFLGFFLPVRVNLVP